MSTGTYWKFAIADLLDVGEFENQEEVLNLESKTEIENGSLINLRSPEKNQLIRERLLRIFHYLKMDAKLRGLRHEIVIASKFENLNRIDNKTRGVTGNYLPVIDQEVIKNLSARFDRAKIPNPFVKLKEADEVVIHYRLGDMRKMLDRSKNFGGHGIVDPVTFAEILNLENISLTARIKVVSDEPEVAQVFLRRQGIDSYFSSGTPSLWDDLKTIGNSKVFIGSMSQFSMFGAVICVANGGKAYLPSSVYGTGDLREYFGTTQFTYYNYKYLPSGHPIFNYA